MSNPLHFEAYIREISYKANLTNRLAIYSLDEFDVNKCRTSGLIKTDNTEIAYSKWRSPKRTRSYPFARLYNTYNSSKKITIIPIIIDEGKDGDRDMIQYSTISWMNLLNVYIVLAYCTSASKSCRKGQENKQKLTSHSLDNQFVKTYVREILRQHQSALHWNKKLFEESFTDIWEVALDNYDRISAQTGVEIHSRDGMDKRLEKVRQDFEHFKETSHLGSIQASRREVVTNHQHEFLVEGQKATLSIKNYLGGLYYLAPDAIFWNQGRYIIQESKNSSKGYLPSKDDIQDGLFKLILFSNCDSLTLNGEQVEFVTKLNLTGTGIIGNITFPDENGQIDLFLAQNHFSRTQQRIIRDLSSEATENNLLIEISSN
jgi:hypothetical protein